MPYVPVPKDLNTVKTKVAFKLTKRQLICFSLAAAVGVPIYFLTRGILGTTGAVFLLLAAALPFFFFAIYEKNGHLDVFEVDKDSLCSLWTQISCTLRIF